MGTLEKRKERILKIPKDYTYTEAKQFLLSLGFAEFNKGKTSGSRVKFYRQSDKKIILLHKPHPGDVMNSLTVKDLVSSLKKYGDLP
ncbi:MAG: type II toxin-antitoxin system HicA family toxin [Selenomonadaceae bacterium]|nr:type II toxin-antitoxin system HicA family toxin [Selenomonadaceae bacterium]